MAESVIGAGIEVYGRGPDGGREATFTGTINWPATTDDDGVWNGYTVVQAKQCQTPSSDPAANFRWLHGQLRDEFKTWMNPKSKRRQRFPQYLLVITNVRLSAADPGGGIDVIRADFEKWLDREYDPKDDDGKPRSLRRRGLREVPRCAAWTSPSAAARSSGFSVQAGPGSPRLSIATAWGAEKGVINCGKRFLMNGGSASAGRPPRGQG
jgi:hypothetical protein